MKLIQPEGRIACLIGAMALAAASAMAQDTTTSPAAQPGLISRIGEKVPGGLFGTAGVIIVVLLAIAGITALLAGRKKSEHGGDEIYPEPAAVESSKFEQLLAETQGLFLRIQGGESKGYYRKIEQLARIFLERTGLTGARQMAYEDIQSFLNSGTVPQKQANTLVSIFERCKVGSEREGEKVDFTAAELIKDLRGLVKQAAEDASPRVSQ